MADGDGQAELDEFWKRFNEYNARLRKEPKNPKHSWEMSMFLLQHYEYQSAVAALKVYCRLCPDDLSSLALMHHAAMQICDWNYYKDIFPLPEKRGIIIDAPGRIVLKICGGTA